MIFFQYRSFLVAVLIMFLVGMNYYFENKVSEVKEEISDKRVLIEKYKLDIKVLEAEWSYQNNPKRLKKLADKLGVILEDSPNYSQFTKLQDIPVRTVYVSRR